MVALELVLTGAVLVVAVGILVSVWRLRSALEDSGGVDRDQLSAAIGETWREMDFDRAVSQVEAHASDLHDLHTDLERMLGNPQARGEFGEQQLDVLLGDHLPPDVYGLREQVVDGKRPDAHVRAAAGVICIDSKFPLDNYERYRDATADEERDRYARKFRNDVEKQLAKIERDYVQPSEGTAPFAFAFIPSESVYYHLVTEEYDLLREYTKRGVQVVSPLTLGHKLELVKADVLARQLSEQAEAIQDDLQTLAARFDDVEDEWDTLYRHVSNAAQKADDVDSEYGRLRAAFDRIEEPAIEES